MDLLQQTSQEVKDRGLFPEDRLTHKSVLPDRERFNAVTIPAMKREMADWDERYQLSETKLSERINLDVPYTKSTFARRIADEFEQLSVLGAIIDQALAELWPQQKMGL